MRRVDPEEVQSDQKLNGAGDWNKDMERLMWRRDGITSAKTINSWR
jgi:hypothetical protein